VLASSHGIGHTRIPLGKSNLKPADRERLGDRHLVLGPFIAPPLSLISWRTHHELAGRDHNHLGALRAVLEGVLRLQAALFAAYRLLSEAEWEYVARAGTTTPFSTGRTITTDQANFDGTSTYGESAKGQYRGQMIEVGSFKPNAFGLHDMHGNARELVEDCWHEDYRGAPTDGSAWTTGECKFRVRRGGHSNDNRAVAATLQTTGATSMASGWPEH
jgi:hypothetical protein